MIKIELSVEEVNMVLGALSKLPYESVVGLISKIHQQGTEQVNPVAGEKPKKSK